MAGTLLMVRMVRLLAVRRLAFCDCRDNVRSVRNKRSHMIVAPARFLHDIMCKCSQLKLRTGPYLHFSKGKGTVSGRTLTQCIILMPARVSRKVSLIERARY